MENKEIFNILFQEFDEFMKEENLKIIKKECSKMVLSICLSDSVNYIYMYHSFHPYDYPYEFMVCYGKHATLKYSDIKLVAFSPNIPLWWLDTSYKPALGEEDKKESVIRNGCTLAKMHFNEFKSMSAESVTKEYEKLVSKANTQGL